jgi:catalase-peroxidase
MGFKTFGFGGGRADVWEPERMSVGARKPEWLGDERHQRRTRFG